MRAHKIREAKVADVARVAELVARLKRLNGEFDPMLKLADKVHKDTTKYIENAISSKQALVLLSELEGKITGVLKADIRQRLFYEPRLEGAIVEFYVLPEYRRTNLGKRMLDEGIKKLRARGAEIITAEFPSLNKLAVAFYEKLGFRAIISSYAKEF